MHSIYNPNASSKHNSVYQHAQHICAYNYYFSPRTLVTQLQDVINKLTSSQHPQLLSTLDPAPNQEKSDSLKVVLDQPQPLEQENHPHVCYWCKGDWVKYAKQQHNHGQVPSRLGFLTDEDGSLVTESRIKTFMSAAKQAWNELYHIQLDPSLWMKKTLEAASYLTYIMKMAFNEFRYCNGDWKVKQFAIIKYPDWCHDVREPGHLTCMSGILFSHCF